jgi:succinate dehydrogenase / fumarate reductase, cytochrome b subunit
MAQVATSVAQPAHREGHSFLWRRLHSLSGVVPVGGFLCYHIFENATALRGPAAYNEMVHSVNTMLPRQYFWALELFGIIIPLLFHSLYGVYIASTGQQNVGRYAYGSNVAYWVQRISGYLAFVYIVVHVGVLRGWVTLLGNHLAPNQTSDLVTYDDVAAHLGNSRFITADSWMTGNGMFVLYLVGTLMTLFHFTNGLNGFAWTWGLAAGRVAQRRVQSIAWALFLVLGLATLNILFSMRFATKV